MHVADGTQLTYPVYSVKYDSQSARSEGILKKKIQADVTADLRIRKIWRRELPILTGQVVCPEANPWKRLFAPNPGEAQENIVL